MASIRIFGYGSLVNKQSLLRTSPDATDIQAVYIKDFRRSFNLWDERGLTAKSHGPLRGQPYCALDIEDAAGVNLNGVVFTIAKSLEEMKSREYMYRLIETEAFDFATEMPIGRIYVFSAGRNDGSYVMDSPAQTRYLGMCLAGAESLGRKFYNQFLATTYVGDQALSDLPELVSSGQNYIDDLT